MVSHFGHRLQYLVVVISLSLRNQKSNLVALCFRVPLLCDFEPLHQHVLALHNLVKAAQSLDEMSQTITDLLSEQKANPVLCSGSPR